MKEIKDLRRKCRICGGSGWELPGDVVCPKCKGSGREGKLVIKKK